MRHVAWPRLRRDENDVVLGLLPQAFQLREDEDALSVNWLERTSGDENEQLRTAARLIRDSQRSKKLSPKSRLAVAQVGVVHDVCRNHGTRVRIIHEPVEGNEPHSSIRQLPREDLVLFEALAAEAVKFHRPCGDLF